MAKRKARRGIINLYVLSTRGMERKCNETGGRDRKREREKKGRSENQFREVDEERGRRGGVKNNEERLKL